MGTLSSAKLGTSVVPPCSHFPIKTNAGFLVVNWGKTQPWIKLALMIGAGNTGYKNIYNRNNGA